MITSKITIIWQHNPSHAEEMGSYYEVLNLGDDPTMDSSTDMHGGN
jgi:hypothetical protein